MRNAKPVIALTSGEPAGIGPELCVRLASEMDVMVIGDRSLQERLVGNAFPQLWAEAIGAHIAAELGERLPSAA